MVVKKYANRRVYNTESSSYITLENLAEMVRQGRDFVVYDAKSGEDITRGVLTQIIVEEEGKGRALLPTAFLRQLIGFYGDQMQSVVPRFLEQAMSALAQQQEQMRGDAEDHGQPVPVRQHRGGRPPEHGDDGTALSMSTTPFYRGHSAEQDAGAQELRPCGPRWKACAGSWPRQGPAAKEVGVPIPRQAVRALAMKARINAGSLTPRARSTPEETSTALAPVVRIASTTLSTVRPPASIHGAGCSPAVQARPVEPHGIAARACGARRGA